MCYASTSKLVLMRTSNPSTYTVRFDDISANSDNNHALDIVELLTDRLKKVNFIWAISPLVSTDVKHPDSQRIFPSIFNAHSDHSVYYRVNHLGIPDVPNPVIPAGHGLIHVDHRLLDYDAQEMSIVASCSLANATIFVPPFNKWNSITDSICQKHCISLVKFEDGWKSIEHEPFDKSHKLWYLHANNYSSAQLLSVDALL
jgi:hypothetical protein